MLEGKVVVVTGAGRGIGRELALEIARQGASVVVNDLGAALDGQGQDQGPAAAVVEEIRRNGGSAVAHFGSVSDWGQAQNIVAAALDNFGRIDGLVNNAGILRDRFFFNMEPEEWRAVIDVHLHGSFYMARAAAQHFKQQQSGAYVHFVSTSGLIGNLAQANYSAAKMGIVALSKSIAMDMERYHVRSNCVSPFASSRMIGSIPTEGAEAGERVKRLQAMEPAKIAPLVAYLLTDSASDVSGQIFAVRANEVFLMSQIRPIRSMHADSGWTVQTIADRAMPAFRGSFYPLDRSQDVFSWDPV
ncbi:SDR family NAD(P)-dependent oxidoreductase [Rhizobium sp. C4]|uniref:SDR family NAD(P)-dependent oxidoreductase n=1 Tax=Rhizobium sp. C4 TaxID=1349800 RepID=UPI001E4254F4|nr:SDR family NAD(P)-dependent oxidoreductase [Rhizobium sp. C4]MCD2175170.1 SDR family NAD(P)-dependent oxidoreductase [Rhizobium sp. C4]